MKRSLNLVVKCYPASVVINDSVCSKIVYDLAFDIQNTIFIGSGSLLCEPIMKAQYNAYKIKGFLKL